MFNSLEKHLQLSIAHAESAKEMWDNLKERFTQGNAPQIHQIKIDLCNLRQEGLSISTYYTKMKGMRYELDDHINIPLCTCDGCTCGAAGNFTKEKEIERVHQFLMGLNNDAFGGVHLKFSLLSHCHHLVRFIQW